MKILSVTLFIVLSISLCFPVSSNELIAVQKHESFDQDPGWDEHNNRGELTACRTTRQDFGFSPNTSHAGGEKGEMGGFIQPAADLAYYAKVLPTKTFEDVLSASGTLCLSEDYARGHVTLGFFKNETYGWRTPHSITLRIIGRGNCFYAFPGYLTGLWRAGEDVFGTLDPSTGKKIPHEFSVGGAVHHWSMKYDPNGNDGGGTITATMDDQTMVVHLDPGHKADGATFNRFGLMPVMKTNDDAGQFWFDDITINGAKEDFSTDPGWEGFQNRRTYEDCLIRPRFNFGYSPTNHAGKKAGEMGGITFRGDWKYPEKLAYYGDRLEELSLDGPLKISGRICFVRGITDAGTLIGFFHAKHSFENGTDSCGIPQDFLGMQIDGPSAEGFFTLPACRNHGTEYRLAARGPRIYPDGTAHDWTMEYSPSAAGGNGQITVSLDGKSVSLDLSPEVRKGGGHFNRFGIITTQVDGNYHFIYFDDLDYTCRQIPVDESPTKLNLSPDLPGESAHYTKMPDMNGIGPTTEEVNLQGYSRVLHVSDSKGSPGGSGDENQPFKNIEQAFEASWGVSDSRRCAILVAGGSYQAKALPMQEYVDLYGGFDPQDWRNRNIREYPTVLDAGQAGPVLIGANHARLDGFWITGGKNDGMGGGIVCHSVSPTLSNNYITGNKTLYTAPIAPETLHLIGHEGAGIAVWDGAHPVIRNNLIFDNSTDVGDGGGISVREHSNPVITGNVIVGNKTGLTDTTIYDGKVGSRSSNGGGISVSTLSAPQVTRNVISLNVVHNTSDGGGIYAEYESTPYIGGNWLTGNTTSDDGGAIYTRGLEDMSSPVGAVMIEGNQFAGNKVYHEGRERKGYTEAIFLSKRGRAVIRNNLFVGQMTGIGVANSTMITEGNTIVDHTGPGIYVDLREELPGIEQSTVTGNIIWGNGREVEVNREFSTPPRVENNVIQGGFEGGNNEDTDLGFIDNRIVAKVISIAYKDKDCITEVQVDQNFPEASLSGRLARIGEKWSVIQKSSPGRIAIWGDLRDSSDSLYIAPTYERENL